MDRPRIYADTLQKDGKHKAKEKWWAEHGIEVVPVRFNGLHGTPSFGDYWAEGSNVSVDTKRHVEELAMNVRRDHKRFKREILRAQDEGFRLVVLTENKLGYEDASDVVGWTNTVCLRCMRCDPMSDDGCEVYKRKPIQGPTLSRALATMSDRYGVEFSFCDPGDSARIVCERLGVNWKR